MRITVILLLFGMLSLAAGCQNGLALAGAWAPEPAQADLARGGVAGGAPHGVDAAKPPVEAPVAAAQEQVPHLAAVDPRKVVYTGVFDIVVADAAEAVAAAKRMAESAGGYMQRMTRSSIVIRVPADKFDHAVAELEKMGPVTSKDVQALDVTDRYVDLELRLKNSRALLGKLEALLAKAESVKDALGVEKELARVRTEVERLEGQLKLLAHRIALATITANFEATPEGPRGLRAELPFWWLSRLGLDELMDF